MSIALHKKFISGVAALSIFVTALGASQAEAGNRDAETALAAFLGLAIIGAVIADRQKDDRPVASTRHHAPKVHPRPLPRRVAKPSVPQRCLRDLNTDRGPIRMFGRRCMEKYHHNTRALPRECERHVNTHRGVRHGWGARCLSRYGFQTAHR